MITNKCLINIGDLRAYTPVSNNFDVHWINGFVESAQLQYVIPCIGKPLFDELLLQFNANTLTPENVNLLDNYLKRVIAWYTYLIGYSSMLIRPENKGININTDDKSVAVTPNLLAYMKTDIQNNANTFIDELKKFLDDNHADYPLYDYDNGCECDKTCGRGWGFGGTR